MSEKLKPCPFCGKQPVRDCLPSGKVWCGVHTTAMREAHWNTRAKPDLQAGDPFNGKYDWPQVGHAFSLIRFHLFERPDTLMDRAAMAEHAKEVAVRLQHGQEAIELLRTFVDEWTSRPETSEGIYSAAHLYVQAKALLAKVDKKKLPLGTNPDQISVPKYREPTGEPIDIPIERKKP